MKLHLPLSIFETIADIAYLAGTLNYYSGDSRADMQEFVWLAEQFVQMHRETDWGEDGDYMLAVEAFALERLEGKMKEVYF